jgi:hypothetical protein
MAPAALQASHQTALCAQRTEAKPRGRSQNTLLCCARQVVCHHSAHHSYLYKVLLPCLSVHMHTCTLDRTHVHGSPGALIRGARYWHVELIAITHCRHRPTLQQGVQTHSRVPQQALDRCTLLQHLNASCLRGQQTVTCLPLHCPGRCMLHCCLSRWTDFEAPLNTCCIWAAWRRQLGPAGQCTLCFIIPHSCRLVGTPSGHSQPGAGLTTSDRLHASLPCLRDARIAPQAAPRTMATEGSVTHLQIHLLCPCC